jgi:hypothetical protein
MYLTYKTGVGGIGVLYSHLHLSHPLQEISPDTIKWLISTSTTDTGNKMDLYVQVGKDGTKYAAEQIRHDKKPGNDLLGTWERTGTETVSTSRLEGIDVSYTKHTGYST